MKLLVKVALAAAMAATAPVAYAAYPDKPITIIVPSAPGGAGDTAVRILMQSNQDHNVFGVPIQIKNSPGGGGAVASQQVKAAAPDGYTILALHQGLITAKVVGVVNYGPEAFVPIAQVASQCLVYGASGKSGFTSYKQLVDAVKSGKRVREAANIGAPAYFASTLLNNAAGVKVSIVQAGEGAQRLSSLIGGNTDVSIFAVSEALAYKPDGITPLVLLSDERDPHLPDVPTAAELGYNVDFCIGNWLMAPKGTPQAVVDRLVEGLKAMFAEKSVQDAFSGKGYDPRLVSGVDFEALIDKSTEEITELGASLKKGVK
jgi:tripartite-type tricarboxylate transporter receptor subunit TctC